MKVIFFWLSFPYYETARAPVLGKLTVALRVRESGKGLASLAEKSVIITKNTMKL
jgi:hypothetical protein